MALCRDLFAANAGFEMSSFDSYFFSLLAQNVKLGVHNDEKHLAHNMLVKNIEAIFKKVTGGDQFAGSKQEILAQAASLPSAYTDFLAFV